MAVRVAVRQVAHRYATQCVASAHLMPQNDPKDERFLGHWCGLALFGIKGNANMAQANRLIACVESVKLAQPVCPLV